MMHLRVFVYGTLKQGGWNHDEWCSGYLSLEPASVWGRLHIRHTGTPILELPTPGIIDDGSTDSNAWVEVRGELLTFDEDPERLRKFDELEDFFPGTTESTYERVTTRLLSPDNHTAWTYIIPTHKSPMDFLPAQNPAEWDPFVEITPEQWRWRFGTDERVKLW